MSAASQTKIFGIRVGVDPKILLGSLIAAAALLFWYNSSGGPDTGTAPTVTSTRQEASAPVATTAARARVSPARRQRGNAERGALRLRPIDATRGDVDPTLRLDLLAKVQSVRETVEGRNLFEIGPPPAAALPKITGPNLLPKPLQQPTMPVHSTGLSMQVSIPLKYYGYVRSMDQNEAKRGLFLDNDNVLVATEGDLLKGRFLVVELTPNTARMEDTQLKQRQVLPVVPVAMP